MARSRLTNEKGSYRFLQLVTQTYNVSLVTVWMKGLIVVEGMKDQCFITFTCFNMVCRNNHRTNK